MDDNQLSRYGGISKGYPFTAGKVFFVINNGNAWYSDIEAQFPPDSEGQIRTYSTKLAAYNATVTNRNDVILIDAASSHSAAMLTVAKNRIHFVGMDGGGRKNSQGSKLITPATSVAASVAVIKNTGTRNTYENIKFVQNGTNAAQISAFEDTGEGTYVKNCGMEVNSILSTVTQGLLFKGDTCHYEDCQFGNSTVYHTAQNQAPLVFKTPARYSYFINCSMINYSSQTDASCIDVPDTNGVIGWIKFENCSLVSANLGDGAIAGGTMAEGVTNAGTSGYLLFDNRCTSYNATIFAEAVAYTLNAAPAGAATAGGGEAVPGA